MDPLGYLNIAAEKAYPTPYATSPLLPLVLISLASQRHSPKTKYEFRDEYDYIVVGAGSAGSVVASRLSEILCVNVLLLEAGKHPPRLTEIPAIGQTFFDTDIDWSYLTTPQKYTAAGMKDRRIPWHAGKMLGGSSSMNGMIYIRGNRRNYDEWAALGAEGWSYDDVLPYFKKLEDNTDLTYVANGYHGVGGPVTATRPFYYPEKKLAVMDAVLDMGYSFVDSNAREQTGFYDYQLNIRKGQRCGTAKAYLVPSEARPNLDIVPNAMVKKVIIENKNAIGVELDYNGVTRCVSARREVILSAGAINTPQLLMLSGIGPMSEMEKHKIPLIADLPVGLNFQDHPGTGTTYEVDSSLPRFKNELIKESNIMEYINNKTGPLEISEGIFMMAFLSNCDTDLDGIIDHIVYVGDVKETNTSSMVCGVQLAHPHSTGTVSLHSADPYDKPEIDPNYFADFRDINDMVEGLKKCNRIMSHPLLKRIGAKPHDPILGCEEFSADEDLYLRCLVRTHVFTTHHPVGTARMGDPEDPRTVVDPQLRVKGIRKLRVVDASVMPKIPWSNTNIPTFMVAEKASDIIKSSIQCHPEPTINWQPFSMFPKIQPTWPL